MLPCWLFKSNKTNRMEIEGTEEELMEGWGHKGKNDE